MDDDEIFVDSSDDLEDFSDDLEDYWVELSTQDLGSQTVSEIRRLNASGGDWWD